MSADYAVALEDQIEQWRSYLRRRQVIHSVDVAGDDCRDRLSAIVPIRLTKRISRSPHRPKGVEGDGRLKLIMWEVTRPATELRYDRGGGHFILKRQ